MNILVQHIPHAIPVVAIWGLMIHYWLVQRRAGRDPSEPVAAAPAPAVAAPPTRAVRRSVAARGLLALGPLIGALGTGLVIYAVNLGQGHAAATAIWAHVGLSLLALLLVAYKIADIGLARIRASMHGASAWRAAGSLALLALWVPLLVSGVALLITPSEASFTAYAHLIASVWWTGLLIWHLRHYLARAVRVVVGRPEPTAGIAVAMSGVQPMPPGGTRASNGRGVHQSRARSTVVPPAGRSQSGSTEPTAVTAEDGAAASIPGR
jgi:hypothetical protein